MPRIITVSNKPKGQLENASLESEFLYARTGNGIKGL